MGHIKKYNVCIVGAGPAGLASLSALQEPYSLDRLNDTQINQAIRFLSRAEGVNKKVCVVDPNPAWMCAWNRNFDTLDIDFLRSPALAHPDHFDQNALLAFATSTGREEELLKSEECLDDPKLLAQSHAGLWKLPSAKLFHDFCVHMSKQLPHEFIQGKVVDLDKQEGQGCPFKVKLSCGSELVADAVVLTVGVVGHPICPCLLRKVPSAKMFQWTELKSKLTLKHRKVLVVGGGLTAVQVAQYALRQGKEVALCSRRPLVERHFDISEAWFDLRTRNKRMADFYHQPEETRLSVLRESRGGGSVPPIYIKDLRKWQERERLMCLVGQANFLHKTDQGSLAVVIDNKIHNFDCIVLACGMEPNCTIHPLVKNLQDKWPIKMIVGLPCISEDLEWTNNLFVVGSLGGLNTGPDAGNLMGIRRASSIVANALECRCWLHECKVLASPFEVLWEEDDTSEEES